MTDISLSSLRVRYFSWVFFRYEEVMKYYYFLRYFHSSSCFDVHFHVKSANVELLFEKSGENFIMVDERL